MADRGRLPDGLFLWHPQIEREQASSIIGLLFLLDGAVDPAQLAARLAPQLIALDELPADGSVVPVWVDDDEAWDCDTQAVAETRAQVSMAPVMAVALEEDPDGDTAGFVYRPLPADLTADARATVTDALGQALN